MFNRYRNLFIILICLLIASGVQAVIYIQDGVITPTGDLLIRNARIIQNEDDILGNVWNPDILTSDTIELSAGAIMYGDGSGMSTELASSTDGYILTLDANGWPSWAAAGAGSGDVTGVGDCADGACLDGSADGGSYIRIYDGDSNYLGLSASSTMSADLTFTFPAADGSAGQVLTTYGDAGLYWTTGGGGGTVTSVDMSVPTGLAIAGNPITTSGTLALTYDTGYGAVKTASTTNWNTFYDTPSNRITAGTNISWSTNTLNVDDAFIKIVGDTTGAMTEDLNLDDGTFVLDYDGNRVGIGTTTPEYLLDVDGNLRVGVEGNANVFYTDTANSNTTFINASTTQLTIANRLYDSNSDEGTLGLILSSTGSATDWIATSTFKIALSDTTGDSDDILEGSTNLFLTGNELNDSDFASDGLMVRTAANTYANRTIATSSDRIIILDAGGVAGNPTFDLRDTAITSLPSLATVGTIATGVWQATDVGVAYGGTGVSTLTDHGVLVGSGASAITALTVGTNGQLLIGSGSADPVFAALTCDTSLTCTTGAGTLEIDVDDDFIKLVGDTTGAMSANLNLDANTFVLDYSNNRIGLATTTPAYVLDVYGDTRIDGTATTTGNFIVGKESATTFPGCLKIQDTDSGGWSYGYVLNGAITWGSTDCTGSATSTLQIGQ